MHLTTLLIFSFAAFTAAQNTTTAIIQIPSTTTWALSPQQSCLASCQVTNVDCRAGCVGAAHPSNQQLSLANDCSMACPQSDGTVAQTNTYNACLSACALSFLPTTETTTDVPAVSVATGTVQVTVTGKGSGVVVVVTGSATATGSVAVQTVSHAAGATAGPFVGGLGLLMMALAL